MISEAVVNLSVVGFTCLLLIAYLVKFVFRYKHEYESNPLCTFAVIICLFVVFLKAFLLPVDIFLVSFVKEPDGSFKTWANNQTLASINEGMFATYYALYGITTVMIFIVLPFLHFFNDDSETNPQDRLHTSIKYTFLFALGSATLLLIGSFLDKKAAPNSIFDKLLPKNSSELQHALNLVLAIITTAGFFNVSFYTASGIFSWPIGLILGTNSASSRHGVVSDRADLLRTRMNALKDKAKSRRLSPREQEQLDQAEEELRQLDLEETTLSDYRRSMTYKFRNITRPIQVLTGVIFSALSLLLIITMITVNIDRILHSNGPKEGYILTKQEIFNMLDYVNTRAQDILIIGPLPVLIITCFLIVATISGIRNLGLWLLLTRLYRVKVGRTSPQALIFFCMTLMLTALAFDLTLYSMTSDYVTFGSQHFKFANQTVQPCTVANYSQDCLLTRSSVFLMQMMSQIWIFGAIFYWWSWVFVAVGMISFVAYVKRGKRDASHDLIRDDENDFED